LLDLLATGDRAGVDASLEVFARGYAGSWWERDSSDVPVAPTVPVAPGSTANPCAS
jgi:hypothetical protein